MIVLSRLRSRREMASVVRLYIAADTADISANARSAHGLIRRNR